MFFRNCSLEDWILIFSAFTFTALTIYPFYDIYTYFYRLQNFSNLSPSLTKFVVKFERIIHNLLLSLSLPLKNFLETSTKDRKVKSAGRRNVVCVCIEGGRGQNGKRKCDKRWATRGNHLVSAAFAWKEGFFK